MKKIFLFIFFGFSAFNLFAQEKIETVKIAKNQSFLFRGIGQEISNGYLYVDEEGYFYFVMLTISQSEVLKWFEQRKDSQNVYKGMLQNGQYKTLSLTRENEPGESIVFYFEKKEKEMIQLISLDDGKIYDFTLIQSN
jgi:hypothetical protein